MRLHGVGWGGKGRGIGCCFFSGPRMSHGMAGGRLTWPSSTPCPASSRHPACRASLRLRADGLMGTLPGLRALACACLGSTPWLDALARRLDSPQLMQVRTRSVFHQSRGWGVGWGVAGRKEGGRRHEPERGLGGRCALMRQGSSRGRARRLLGARRAGAGWPGLHAGTGGGEGMGRGGGGRTCNPTKRMSQPDACELLEFSTPCPTDDQHARCEANPRHRDNPSCGNPQTVAVQAVRGVVAQHIALCAVHNCPPTYQPTSQPVDQPTNQSVSQSCSQQTNCPAGHPQGRHAQRPRRGGHVRHLQDLPGGAGGAG